MGSLLIRSTSKSKNSIKFGRLAAYIWFFQMLLSLAFALT